MLAVPAMYLVYKISIMVMLTHPEEKTFFSLGSGLLQAIISIAILFTCLKVPKMIDGFIGYSGSMFPEAEKKRK